MGRLKWFHCLSQMVSFWVAVSKLLPLGAKLVSFWMIWNHRVSNRLTWSQLVSIGLILSGQPETLRPKGLKWPHSEWCGFRAAKAVSVGLNWSYFELHSLSSTHTMLTSSHSEGLFPNRGRLDSLWMRYACYSIWASINLTGCPMFGHIYAEGENVMVICLLQNYLQWTFPGYTKKDINIGNNYVFFNLDSIASLNYMIR